MIPQEEGRSDVIRFGTDGWRAVIGDEFTFRNLERVTQAYADHINSPSSPTRAETARIIIGYDRRFLSKEFAQVVAQIMAGNDIEYVLFDEDVPTPLVSWGVRDQNAAGGLVITASHNPPEYNGFKIKSPSGNSAPNEVTSAVESLIDARPPTSGDCLQPNDLEITQDIFQSYRRQIATFIDLDRIRKAEVKITIDPMHGVGGTWVESFLRGGLLECETIHSRRDPLFGGVDPEPVDRNLVGLKRRVIASHSILGLATDGDADRLGAVDEHGRVMAMHAVVPMLLLHLLRGRAMAGDVVTTFSQSVLTKRIAAAHNLHCHEIPIGFKYVADLMLRKDILIGAEESGGIGVKGHLPERDGILNSLLLLEAVIATGMTPTEIIREIHREFGEFHSDRRDVAMNVLRGREMVAELASSPPLRFAGYPITDVQELDGTKLLLSDDSWLLFRQSGTEPVLRIYAEATTRAKTDELIITAVSMVHRNM